MNLRISIKAILALILVTISACIKVDDPVIDIPTGTAKLSAKINGEEFSVSGILVTAEYVVQNEMVRSLAIGGAEPPINGITRAIALAIVSTDSSEIETGETYTATSTINVGAGEYNYDNGAIDIKALSANTGLATITITDIDYSSKLVSGTFSFDGVDDNDPGTIYKITEGIFKDVSW